MNPLEFMKGIAHSAYVGGLNEADKASKFLERHSGSRLTSNIKIKDAIENRALARGMKKGEDDFIDQRRNVIFDKRMANPKASEWGTNILMADGLKGKVGSFFFSGETGNLSKARIAGVAAGLGLGAHHVLSSDDD